MASFKSFTLGLFLVIFSLSSLDVGYASRKLFQVQSSNVLENLKQTLNELQKHINSPDPPREADLKQIASLLKRIRDLLPRSDPTKPTQTPRSLQSTHSRLLAAMENFSRKRKLQNLGAISPPPSKYPRFARSGQPSTPRPPTSGPEFTPPYYKALKGNGASVKSTNPSTTTQPSGTTNQAFSDPSTVQSGGSRRLQNLVAIPPPPKNPGFGGSGQTKQPKTPTPTQPMAGVDRALDHADPSKVKSGGSRRLSTLLTISNDKQPAPVDMSTTPELPLLLPLPRVHVEGLPRVRVEGVPPLKDQPVLRHLPKPEELPTPISLRPENPSSEEMLVQVSQPLDQDSGNTRTPKRLLLATRRHLLSSTGPHNAGNGGTPPGIMSTYTFNQMMNSKVNHGPKKKSH